MVLPRCGKYNNVTSPTNFAHIKIDGEWICKEQAGESTTGLP